jgi:hypothetical protein
VTWRGGVTMSVRGEAAPGKGKGGGDASWPDVNLTRQINEENPHKHFSWYKWVIKI